MTDELDPTAATDAPTEAIAPPPAEPTAARPRRPATPTLVIGGAVAIVLFAGGALYAHAHGDAPTALAAAPRPVAVVAAVARPFQPTRRYVGTVEPWLSARVGPQLVAAYVDTVLVRPGAIVKRGDILATLDCRNASAANKAAAAQARALEAGRAAAAGQAARVSSLLDGKYVSQNEVDVEQANAATKSAQLAAASAQELGSSLQVSDCVLRAPFDGEVATRDADPGAFARPGAPIITIVDRHVARITADVPEDDFDAVAPGTSVRVHLLATRQDLVATIARRAPAADPATRTARIELDLADAAALPVWTTAELRLDVGSATPATAIPLVAASVHGTKASVFVVDHGVAHATTAKVIGERGGALFVATTLAAGSLVVSEGRGLLGDNDAVAATTAPWSPDDAGAGK